MPSQTQTYRSTANLVSVTMHYKISQTVNKVAMYAQSCNVRIAVKLLDVLKAASLPVKCRSERVYSRSGMMRWLHTTFYNSALKYCNTSLTAHCQLQVPSPGLGMLNLWPLATCDPGARITSDVSVFPPLKSWITVIFSHIFQTNAWSSLRLVSYCILRHQW